MRCRWCLYRLGPVRWLWGCSRLGRAVASVRGQPGRTLHSVRHQPRAACSRSSLTSSTWQPCPRAHSARSAWGALLEWPRACTQPGVRSRPACGQPIPWRASPGAGLVHAAPCAELGPSPQQCLVTLLLAMSWATRAQKADCAGTHRAGPTGWDSRWAEAGHVSALGLLRLPGLPRAAGHLRVLAINEGRLLPRVRHPVLEAGRRGLGQGWWAAQPHPRPGRGGGRARQGA